VLPVPVDYESAVPPSRQIADQLRGMITAGDLAPGARLPSITTLMQEYGVARNTARRALAILEDEGLIEIVHGWGSFVRKG
jgi:GntR family transcriptional regulator